MISKTKLQSCCGSESFLYILKNPILKEHAKTFEDAGFIIMQNFLKAGILQATKRGLTFTVTIGHSKVNVRCSSKGCQGLFVEFENILDTIDA